MPDLLALYLRTHEAAGRAGADLARRAARGQRRRPWGGELGALQADIAEDLRALQALMGRLRVRPDPLLARALQVGERVGRLKPNGHLLTRSPLSDLAEVEALLDAVFAKANGWRALIAAGVAGPEAGLDEALARAEDQLARLLGVHDQVAAAVLTRR